MRCNECGDSSARFDTYTHLSVPLPLDTNVLININGRSQRNNVKHNAFLVVRLDGQKPCRYGVRLPAQQTVATLRAHVVNTLNDEGYNFTAASILILELAATGRLIVRCC